MPATNTVKFGLEGFLYYCTDPKADEATIEPPAEWKVLGYVTDFNIRKAKNKIRYYNKRVKQGAKQGRIEITGSIGQLYTNYAESIVKLADDDTTVALKLEICEDDGTVANETYYINDVDFDNPEFNPGNLNEAGEMTLSVDYDASEYHVVAAV